MRPGVRAPSAPPFSNQGRHILPAFFVWWQNRRHPIFFPCLSTSETDRYVSRHVSRQKIVRVPLARFDAGYLPDHVLNGWRFDGDIHRSRYPLPTGSRWRDGE
ncbi:hypothetical protein DESC_120067 [Desulfosarcina cetonica]|nr:hypothetical protein DESC_120067 [Desulfosarcina cetonica]